MNSDLQTQSNANNISDEFQIIMSFINSDATCRNLSQVNKFATKAYRETKASKKKLDLDTAKNGNNLF